MLISFLLKIYQQARLCQPSTRRHYDLFCCPHDFCIHYTLWAALSTNACRPGGGCQSAAGDPRSRLPSTGASESGSVIILTLNTKMTKMRNSEATIELAIENRMLSPLKYEGQWTERKLKAFRSGRYHHSIEF
jgi:hypothetical protein